MLVVDIWILLAAQLWTNERPIRTEWDMNLQVSNTMLAAPLQEKSALQQRNNNKIYTVL